MLGTGSRHPPGIGPGRRGRIVDLSPRDRVLGEVGITPRHKHPAIRLDRHTVNRAVRAGIEGAVQRAIGVETRDKVA